MSNRPNIFAFCGAGCKWEVPHKRDVEESVAFLAQPMVDGKATVDVGLSYQIEADPLTTSSVKTISGVQLPTNVKAGRKAATVGDNIYLFGADDEFSFSGTIQVFNTATEELRTLQTKLPYALFDMAVAAVGTRIYLFGGKIDNESSPAIVETDCIIEFNTLTEQATVLSTKLPRAMYGIGAAAIGERIYLFGGLSKSTGSLLPFADIYLFNALNKTISKISTEYTWLGELGAGYIGASAYEDKIYLCGGWFLNDDGVTWGQTNAILAFDIETEQITKVGDMSEPLFRCGVAVAGGNIFIAGGRDGSKINGFVSVFDIKAGKTVKSYPLTTPAFGVGIAVSGTKVYTLGGGNDQEQNEAQIQWCNYPTYDCKVSLVYEDNGVEAKSNIPINVYDKYRTYFRLEALSFETFTTYAEFVYEINGQRHTHTVYGTNIRQEAKIEITSNNVFMFNEGTKTIGLVGMTGAIPEVESLPENPDENSPSMVLYDGEIYILTGD